MSLEEPRPGIARPRVNAALLALTVFTVAFSGWLWWEGGFAVWYVRGFSGALREFFTLESMLSVLPYTAALLGILGAHEMGHYLACRYYRIPATLPFFIPGVLFGTFGAVIRIRGIIPNRRALFDIAAAGPIAGFLVALPILVYGVMTATPTDPNIPLPEETMLFGESILTMGLFQLLHGAPGGFMVSSLYLAAWFGLLVTSMNLFPVGQLDGGHAVYAVSPRLHRWSSRLTLVGLITWVFVYSFSYMTLSVYTLWCLILLWMRDRHPRVAFERVPLGRGRTLVAVVLLLLFVLTFMPVPILFVE